MRFPQVRVKTILFLAAALLLAGCGTEAGWVPGENVTAEKAPVRTRTAAPTPPPYVPPAPLVAAAPVAAPTPPPPTYVPPAPVVAAAPAIAAPAPEAVSAVPPPSPVDVHCRAVAHQRSADAHANGYTFAMAQTIYDGTYKDCVAWNSQHSLGTTR